MEKALRDRLLQFKDEVSLSGDNSPEDLKEATLFTLKALKAHLQENKPTMTYDISAITQAVAVVKMHLVE